MLTRLKTPSPTNSRTFFLKIFKNKKDCCEEEEKPITPIPKYVIQKSCGPSIFDAWKPKIPDLSTLPTIKDHLMEPYRLKCCTADINLNNSSRGEIEARARECWKLLHSNRINKCPPRSKYHIDGPLPPLQAATLKCKEFKGKIPKKIKKSQRYKPDPEIPEGDWDPDGYR